MSFYRLIGCAYFFKSLFIVTFRRRKNEHNLFVCVAFIFAIECNFFYFITQQTTEATFVCVCVYHHICVTWLECEECEPLRERTN